MRIGAIIILNARVYIQRGATNLYVCCTVYSLCKADVNTHAPIPADQNCYGRRRVMLETTRSAREESMVLESHQFSMVMECK